MDEMDHALDTIILRDGTVYVSPNPDTDMDGVHCRVGDYRFPFERTPITISTVAPPNQLPSPGSGEDAAWEANGSTVRIGQDISPDWTLAGHHTAFVELSGAGETADARYVVNGSNLIPIPQQGTLLLSGLFAAHRAHGTVELRLFNHARKLVATQSQGFGEDSPGGKTSDGYFEAQFRIAPRPNVGFFSLTVRCANRREPSEHPGYVFIADVSLRRVSRRAERGHTKLLGPQRHPGSANVFRCVIPPEAFVRSRADLCLVMDGAELVLQAVDDVQVDAISNDIWSIQLTSDRPCVATLYIDGVYSETLRLRSSPRHVAFSKDIYDGEFHHIAVRDSYGMATYFQDYSLFPQSLTPFSALQRETNAPFPSHLSAAARFRYTGLLNHLRAGSGLSEAETAQLIHAHAILERGFEGLDSFKPLRFRVHEQPLVSIVVPVHNKANVTYFCLCALLFAWNEAPFEIIVVDDGSSDGTLQLPEIIEGVTFLRNESGEGFIRACNKGAVAARGEFIIFLNNDTEPTSGWIDELLAVISGDRVGLVGSKLLYPDGRLQEAGGIVWRTGNPWNYGRLANPWDPRFCYVRQVDYASGAAIMIRAELWRQVGGFSPEYIPAYFEDTDLAFKVLDAGYKTCLAPQSIVFHFEGVSSGTDVASGAKRFQEVNRPKFKQKWASRFRAHGEEGVEPDLEKDRGVVGRVAFLDHSTPRPDFDAGGYAAIQEMKLVKALGYKVTFIPDNVAYLGRYTDDLQRLGIEAVYAPFVSSIAAFIEERGGEFDAFYITRYEVAERYVPVIRRHAPGKKIIFNNADLHFLRMLRSTLQSTEGRSERMREVIDVRDRELEIMRKVDVVLSYNDTEHAVIASHNLDSTNVLRCPWVVDVPENVPSFEDREGISFLGGFRHPPNAEAVNYFLAQVMPMLRQRLPGVKFHIYGSAMPDAIRKRGGGDVVPEGFVKDVSEAYDRHRVFVAPLLSGAGIKGKVLGAMARGTPSILSAVAAEGIGARNGYDVRIASQPAEWVAAIAELYEDRERWEAVSIRSREFVAENYSFDVGRGVMKQAFDAVDLFVA